MSPDASVDGFAPERGAPMLSLASVSLAAAVSLPVMVSPDFWTAPVILESSPAATVPVVVPVFLVAASPSPRFVRAAALLVDLSSVSMLFVTV
jgi:hypothetical protein